MSYNPRLAQAAHPRKSHSRMNVFYEDEGSFKVGAIIADNDTSLQVEAPHGKRSKIKASAVLVRFNEPAPAVFVDAAQKVAADVDVRIFRPRAVSARGGRTAAQAAQRTDVFL
jgi:hypothetical protein